KSDAPVGRTVPADAAALPHQMPPGYDGLASTEPASRRYYAALDLGTNNCRLLVAQPTRRGFKVKTSFSRIIRLGEGLSASGRLSEDAIARTIDALKVCAGKMHSLRVERAGMIATEACRSATNAREFLNRARQETGLDIKVISRETEAKLA